MLNEVVLYDLRFLMLKEHKITATQHLLRRNFRIKYIQREWVQTRLSSKIFVLFSRFKLLGKISGSQQISKLTFGSGNLLQKTVFLNVFDYSCLWDVEWCATGTLKLLSTLRFLWLPPLEIVLAFIAFIRC